MQPGITLLIVGQNKQERVKKLEEILAQFFPRQAGFNPNIVKISANLGIDDVRNFKLALSQKPYQGAVQVGICEIEEITHEAQNALLKLTEEPKSSTQLIITVDNLAKLQPTIVSRCQIIFTSDETNNAISAVTHKDAKVLAEGTIGEKFSLALSVNNKNGQDWTEKQIVFWRQVFLAKIEAVSHPNDKILEIAKKMDCHKILKILKNFLQVKNLLKLNINQRLLLENLFLSISE